MNFKIARHIKLYNPVGDEARDC